MFHDELLPHESALCKVLDVGRPEAVARQHQCGKRTARERVATLVDTDTFREIGALARPEEPGPDGRVIPADAIVVGTADVDGRPTVVMATDFTAAGGSNGLVGNEKQRRGWEIAGTRGIPVVMLIDGGGHRIQEGLDSRTFAAGFDIQDTLARLSGWVPLVAVIMGPGYGQPTLAASMCDYTIAVRGIATAGMAPPSLVKAATGEDINVDELYSAEAQARFGTVDMVADDEEDALHAVRVYLATLPANSEAPLPEESGLAPEPVASGRLDHVVPSDVKAAYDMHDIVDGLVDADTVVELKSHFAQNILTVLATIDGRPVGILANQPAHKAGILDAPAAAKAARLVSLCNAFGIPILVLMDLPGLSVGREAEEGGLALQAARLSIEFGRATIPKITVLVRKGYGGGYVVMSGGRTFHPELVLAWPHAESGVMGVDAAVDLLYRREMASSADRETYRADLLSSFAGRLGALRAGEGFGVDAIVRPSETRALVAATLRSTPRRRQMQTVTPRVHPVSPL